MKLSIIIPTYNEEQTISKIIDKIKQIKDIKKEIIIVDDYSKDNTREILKKIKNIKVILNKTNLGKGGSIKQGLKICKGEVIIIQDADLEYDPKDYKKVILPIIKNQTKVVFGSRFKNKSNKKGNLITFLGNKAITFTTNLLYLTNLTDQMTCYKAFHKDLKPLLIQAKNNRFDWEPEITAKILKKAHKIQEVPISYYPRTKQQGKKIRVKDGFDVIRTLIKERFSS